MRGRHLNDKQIEDLIKAERGFAISSQVNRNYSAALSASNRVDELLDMLIERGYGRNA
jgi:hypothetical protein